MKGRSVTPIEHAFHHALAGLGCAACRIDGIENPFGSIHHLDGRTKIWAHWLVLFLCAPHHQLGGEVPAIHVCRRTFESRYGTELELLAASHALLGGVYVEPTLKRLDYCKSDLKRRFIESIGVTA
jgi:hypothetical protein